MQGVILAAGKGKRLHPLTLIRTKAMAPVAGRPLAARVLEMLMAYDIREIVMVVSEQDTELRSYFADGEGLGVAIEYVVQRERLGMAHALKLAAPYLHTSFILSACDNLVSVEHLGNLLAAHHQHDALATLSLMPVDPAETHKTGIVAWEEPWVRRIVEKPTPAEAPSNIASLPLYVFDPAILPLLEGVSLSPRGEYELQDAIQSLITQTGRVAGVQTESRQQVTSAADLLALNLHYLRQMPSAIDNKAAQVGQDTQVVGPTLIEPGVVIGARCVIGPHVYIERDCIIGDDVHLHDSLVLRDTTIAHDSQLAHGIFSGELAS